eukprot:TRINITY_DN625_c0_g3_i4.p1 TRINITY_DN625_c0_g3~~TRINITY_DN625_c0_g3_i4.p1  ORF type:complete len:309 (-),score=151.08 TRINITY_DN625_c0_g3_i4:330-1256(-)
MDGLVWKEYETDEGHKYYYNKLDATTTWEQPPDPDSADLNAPRKTAAAAAPAAAEPAPATQVAGTFAIRKTARGNTQGALLEQGAELAPPSSGVAGTGVFSDYHKFVSQFADADTANELAAAERDEPKRRRHRRHVEARAKVLSDIRDGDHRRRLRKSRPSTRGASQRGGGGGNARVSKTASNDFASRASAIAGAIGGGGGGTSRSSTRSSTRAPASARGGAPAVDRERQQLNKLVEKTEDELDSVRDELERVKFELKGALREIDDLKSDNAKLVGKLADAKKSGGSSSSSDSRWKSKYEKLEAENKR